MQTLTNATPLELSRWVGRTVTAQMFMRPEQITGNLVRLDDEFAVESCEDGVCSIIDATRPVTLVECAACQGSGKDYEDRTTCHACGGTCIDPRAGL